MAGVMVGSGRPLCALVVASIGGVLLVACNDLTVQAPALLVVWASGLAARDTATLASARRLLPIALSAFGVALLALLAGTSSPTGIRDALGTANVALLPALPLRMAVLLVALGPLAAMVPATLGGLLPIDARDGVLDHARAGVIWWAGCGALLRLAFGILPPLMQGLRLESVLPLVGGIVALAGGVLAIGAQTATRLLSGILLLRIGVLLAGCSAFEGDVLGGVAASMLIDGAALLVALTALRRLCVLAEGEWLERWEGRGMVDRGPVLTFVVAVAVLASLPGTVQGLTLMMQSRAVVAAGEIAGFLLLALAWTLGIVALVRLVRVLYLRPPQFGTEHAARRWWPGYLLLAALLAALALPPAASYTYRAGRRIVSMIVDAVRPQPPSSSKTQ